MILSVASGKGGTGKTLVATSLAVSLARGGGHAVQLLDCDVEEPNAALLLWPRLTESEVVQLPLPEVSVDLCTGCGRCSEVCQFGAVAVMRGNVVIFPELCCDCGACVYACPTVALEEVGRSIGVVEGGHTEDGVEFWHGRTNIGVLQAGPVIRAVKRHADTAKTVVVDAPPGTACAMQEAIEGSDACLLVTEPTPFGLNDLKAAVETCQALSISCGVILNRAGEADGIVEDYCQREGLPLMLRIPQDRRIAEAYARGQTLSQAFPEYDRELLAVLEQVVTLIDNRR